MKGMAVAGIKKNLYELVCLCFAKHSIFIIFTPQPKKTSALFLLSKF